MILLLIYSCIGLYLVLGLSAIWGVYYTCVPPITENKDLPSVSVLVAVRNEETNLPRCLCALSEQDYPKDMITFILADDQSADRSRELITSYANNDRRFRYVQVPQSGSRLRGKPLAIHTAFQHAQGDLLLFTDADCAPPSEWAVNMAAQFVDANLGAVGGVSVIEGHSLSARLQALDWMLLLTTLSGFSAIGLPVTAMGNNLAVRRAAYEAVGGYPALRYSITEDYTLFRAIHNRREWRVRLIGDAQLKNMILPESSLRATFKQHRRWARGGLKAPLWAYCVYCIVFMAHLLPLLGLLIMPIAAFPALIVKVWTDLLVISTGQKKLNEPSRLRFFTLFECYLFTYILLLPFSLIIAPRIQWKGRTS